MSKLSLLTYYFQYRKKRSNFNFQKCIHTAHGKNNFTQKRDSSKCKQYLYVWLGFCKRTLSTLIQWWPDESLRQKRFLLCINNHWKYENKQYTIEKPYKIATRNAKKNFEFFKICWFLGPFLKNQCFGKMGVAGIKWGQRSSTIPPFLLNLNEEALLKVSFKNIDWFQICPFSKTTAFSKKALKTNKIWIIRFLVAILQGF